MHQSLGNPPTPRFQLQFICIFLVCLILSSCQTTNRSEFDEREVGRSFAISFGRVLDVREIQIRGESTHLGVNAGALAGGVSGAFVGSGDGSIAAIGAGILVGAILGASTERLLRDRKGLEYTVKLDSEIILNIIQEVPEKGEGPKPGERIFVKNAGGYQRVMPMSDLPKGVTDQ